MKGKFILTLLMVTNVCYAQLDKTYSSAEYVIKYPAQWSLDTSRQIAAALFFYSPLENLTDNFSENVNVLTQNLIGQNIDLEAYKAITEKQITTMALKGKILYSRIEKIRNVNRYDVEYQVAMNNNDLHIRSVCYIKNEIAYLVTFTAKIDTYEKYRQVGTTILESFQLR